MMFAPCSQPKAKSSRAVAKS